MESLALPILVFTIVVTVDAIRRSLKGRRGYRTDAAAA